MSVDAYRSAAGNYKSWVTAIPNWISDLELTTAENETLKVGESLSIKANCIPYDYGDGGSVSIDRKLIAISSDDDIVQSDYDAKESPVVKALRPGTADISVETHNGIRKTIHITVTDADNTSISLSKSQASIVEGESFDLTANVYPNLLSDDVVWTTSRLSAASVYKGRVIGRNLGTAVITATLPGGQKASCTVTVGYPVDDIEINKGAMGLSGDELEMAVGITKHLAVKMIPNDAAGLLKFTSSNTAVATVDADGNVTGVAAGTAAITVALASDASINSTINVRVTEPIKATAITLDRTEAELRLGANLQLTATLTPADVDDPSVTWLSSNTAVATVDANGLVTPVRTGRVVITAVPMSAPTLEARCVVDVRSDALLGDADGDSRVLVNDAMMISNYHIGKPVTGFSFEAADIDRDGSITINDVTSCIGLILNASSLHSRSSAQSEADGRLVIGSVAATSDAVITVPVRLESTRAYTGLQADIVMPEGLTLKGVTLGARARGTHSLSMREMPDGSVRIVLFSAAGRSFADTEDALVNLSIAVDDTSEAAAAPVELLSIAATDGAAHCYDLYAVGGLMAAPAGIEDTDAGGDITVIAGSGIITVANATGQAVEIFSADGRRVARRAPAAANETVAVAPGLYIVRAGAQARKILVR